MSSIAARRLANQRISQPQAAPPGQIVAWLGALQGQDYSGALWSIGLRMPSSRESEIEAALAAGLIHRTWLMRGTLQLVAAADLPWMLALLAPRLIEGNARRYHELGLEAETLRRSCDLIAHAIEEQGPLYRADLLAVLQQAGISTEGQRGVYMLQRASLEGLICQGPPRGPQNLFRRLESTAPAWPREQALAELARRYFQSRGPATLADFLWWSGLAAAEGRAAIQAAADSLHSQEIDGTLHWASALVPEPAAPAEGLWLLPGFDEYLIGYRERAALLDARHAGRITPGGNGVFHPYVVVDGQARGLWKASLSRQSLSFSTEPFEPGAAFDEGHLEAAQARYASFREIGSAVNRR